MADESLVNSKNSFEKYKTSLKNLAAKIASSTEAAMTLQKRIIPQLEADVAQAKQQLFTALKVIVMGSKPEVENRMIELYAEVVSLQDEFVFAWDRIFNDLGGLQFVINSHSVLLIPKHDRIKNLQISPRTRQLRSDMLTGEHSDEEAPKQIKGIILPLRKLSLFRGLFFNNYTDN